MSVYSLSSVASLLGKDPKTLRRWCAAGVVQGAVVSSGGHWRIKARNLTAAAKVAKAGAERSIKTRVRLRDHTGAVIPSAHIAKARNPFSASNRKSIIIDTTHAVILDSMPEDLKKIEDMHLDKISVAMGIDARDLLPDSIFDSPLWKSDKRGIFAIAWLIAMPEDPHKKAKDIAQEYGMNVRTFYRRLGHLLPKARKVAEIYQSTMEQTNAGQVFDDSGKVDFVPVDLPAYATEEEIRRWGLIAD